MGKPKPETEAVKAFYAALNAGDIEAALKDFDARIERTEPPGFPASGTYRGIAAIKEHFQKARANWAEGSCEPRRFITAGDKVIALVEVRVRLKHEKEWREGSVADGFTFQNGKIIQFRTFAEERQAFEWVEGSSGA